jgi:small GTP-binding protein
MIQKKICLVGVFATGKTSLVRRFVHSIFSDKYHSTVGVKIDRKQVEVRGEPVNLLLWDLAGRDEVEDIKPSYLRGAAGIFYVVDGTRRETFEQLFELREIVEEAAGDVPSIVALNKFDLASEWKLDKADFDRLNDLEWHHFTTSALSGESVEDAFQWLAKLTLGKLKL